MKSQSLFILSFLILQLLLYDISLINGQQLSEGYVGAKNIANAGRYSGFGTYKITFYTRDSSLSVGYVIPFYMGPFDPSGFHWLTDCCDTEKTIEMYGDIYFVIYNSGNTTAQYSRFSIRRKFKYMSTFRQVSVSIPPRQFETFMIQFDSSLSSKYVHNLFITSPQKRMSYKIVGHHYETGPQTPTVTGFSSINFTSSSLGIVPIPPLPSRIFTSSYYYFLYLRCDSNRDCRNTAELKIDFPIESSVECHDQARVIGAFIGLIIGVVLLFITCFVVVCALVMITRKRKSKKMASGVSTANATMEAGSSSDSPTTYQTLQAQPIRSSVIEADKPQMPYPYGHPQYGNPNYGLPASYNTGQLQNRGPSVASTSVNPIQ